MGAATVDWGAFWTVLAQIAGLAALAGLGVAFLVWAATLPVPPRVRRDATGAITGQRPNDA